MRDNDMQSDVYATADFHTVVYLLCHDAKLVESLRIGPNKIQFVFADKGTCDGLLANVYYSDNVSLSRALHEIKRAREVIRATV